MDSLLGLQGTWNRTSAPGQTPPLPDWQHKSRTPTCPELELPIPAQLKSGLRDGQDAGLVSQDDIGHHLRPTVGRKAVSQVVSHAIEASSNKCVATQLHYISHQLMTKLNLTFLKRSGAAHSCLSHCQTSSQECRDVPELADEADTGTAHLLLHPV